MVGGGGGERKQWKERGRVGVNGAKGDLLLSEWCRSSDHSVRVEAGSGETKPGRD